MLCVLDLVKKKKKNVLLEKHVSAFLSPKEGRSLQQGFGLLCGRILTPSGARAPGASPGQSGGRFLLPSAHSSGVMARWGWGHADVWIGGPAFAPHRAGGGLPVEKRQAPLLRACASSFLPYLPKVKPQKEREKRKEKQDSLGQISPKLQNGSVEGPDPWEEALFGQTL